MRVYNGVDVTSLSLSEIDDMVRDVNQTGKTAGIIYCYINVKNGKRYIGQTLYPKDRHQTHISSSKPGSQRKDANVAIHNAIRKYGINRFRYMVLDFVATNNKNETIEKLNCSERDLIAKYKSDNKHNGYNILDGGWSGTRKLHPAAVPVTQYDLDGVAINHFHSIKEAINITGCKNVATSLHRGKHYANGFFWTMNNDALSQKEIEYHKKLQIYQYTVEGKYIKTFPRLADASKAVNGDSTRILLCAKPPYIHVAYGYRWSNEKMPQLPDKAAHLEVPVCQYDKNGLFVAEYANIISAAKAIGQRYGTHINACLQDEWRKASGFYFRKYKADKISISKHPKSVSLKTIIIYPNGEEKVFDTLNEATIFTGVARETLKKVAKGWKSSACNFNVKLYRNGKEINSSAKSAC